MPRDGQSSTAATVPTWPEPQPPYSPYRSGRYAERAADDPPDGLPGQQRAACAAGVGVACTAVVGASAADSSRSSASVAVIGLHVGAVHCEGDSDRQGGEC